MLGNPPRPPHFSVPERHWKAVVAAGAAEPAAAVWFEEALAIAAEFIGVLLLAALGGVMFLFNHFVFRSRAPRRDDLYDAGRKGKGKRRDL